MENKQNTVREKILEGLQLTHKRLIRTKKINNQDLIISRNGKIIRIHGKDLKIE